MKKTRMVRWTILSVFLLFSWCWLLSPAVTQAEETGTQVQAAVNEIQFASAWPMYMHDPQHTGRSDYRDLFQPLKLNGNTGLVGG